jgi:hypothetical protein
MTPPVTCSYASEEAAKRIISREKERVKKRLEAHYLNTVWEKVGDLIYDQGFSPHMDSE